MKENKKRSIEKILEHAVWAPSGDNSQPWRFEVFSVGAGNYGDEKYEIKIFNVPERDTSLYNFNNSASLVALGALIENVEIASRHHGYAVSVDFFPEGKDSDCVASARLSPADNLYAPLYSYIQERVSNRRPYKKKPLSEEDKQKLLASGEDLRGVSIRLVDGNENMDELARAASVNEKVVLETKKLHEFLFSHITWSQEEDEEKNGLFVKTLELKGPQALAFKLFKHWSVLKFFNNFGVSNLVSKDNAGLYKKSGAFVAIIADNSLPISFLKTGILTQKFWLEATRLNLSVQPLTGVLFLRHRIHANPSHELEHKHRLLVENGYSKIENIFKSAGKPILMMFRVGYDDKPSAKCSRRPPEVEFKK